jgi:hypothetical protein
MQRPRVDLTGGQACDDGTAVPDEVLSQRLRSQAEAVPSFSHGRHRCLIPSLPDSMNASTQALATTLLWSENDNADESGGEPLDANYDVDDIDKQSLNKLQQCFDAFVEQATKLINAAIGEDWGSIEDFYIGTGSGDHQAEHDFIMTVNGHGCGFWEKSDWQSPVGDILTELAHKHGDIVAVVGGDGKIYIEQI